MAGHDVDTAHERGWSTLENGELLSAAERDGYEVLVTTDQNLRYQQNLAGRVIAIVVLRSTSWKLIEAQSARVIAAVDTAKPSDYVEVPI